MDIGVAIRSARRERGWNQRELGDRVGLSQARISAIEGGAAITLPQLDKIEDALGLQRGELLLRSGRLAAAASGVQTRDDIVRRLQELAAEQRALLDRLDDEST